jgi:malate dehydrogenase
MSVIGGREVEAAAATGVLRIRPGDVLTPLAKDRAAALGVRIEVDGAAGRSPSNVPEAPPLRQWTPPPELAAKINGKRGNGNGRKSPPVPAAPTTRTPPPPPSPGPPSAALYRRGAPVVTGALRPDAGAAPAVTPPLRSGRGGRVTVVGAGHVGATCAMRLAEADVFSEVVMVDVVPGLAAGLALDLWHSSGLRRFGTRLRGGTDVADGAGSDFVVLTAGRARQPGMSRTDLTAANAAIVGEVCDAVRRFSPDATVVVVTNPLDEMTHLAWQRTGFPTNRVLGMAGVLDSIRFCSLVALETGVRPETVYALALGSHGEEMVVPLSQARIEGSPIEGRLDQSILDRLVERTRNSGAEVVKLLEKGSAYYAPAASAAEMVVAMARDSKAVLPACVMADGSYGITGTYLGLPARLGRAGVEGIVELPLTSAEVAELRAAAAKIGERVKDLPAPTAAGATAAKP